MKNKIKAIKAVLTLEERKEFVKELKRRNTDIDILIDQIPISMLIGASFFWDTSKKGHDYWSLINKKYTDYLIKNNLF